MMNELAGIINSGHIVQIIAEKDKAAYKEDYKKVHNEAVDVIKKITAINSIKNDVARQHDMQLYKVYYDSSVDKEKAAIILEGPHIYRKINLDGTAEKADIINPVKVKTAYFMDE